MTLTMDREIATEWIEKLEGLDPETQGKGTLNNNGRMCCLGVLCEIAKDKGVVRVTENSLSGVKSYGTSYSDSSQHYLPSPVIKWAGIESMVQRPLSTDQADLVSKAHNPKVQGHHIDHWNDSEGKSFKEIAALLRLEFDLPKTD